MPVENNICVDMDSYKIGHWGMYPRGTTKNGAYLAARQGAHYSETVFVGLQPICMEHLVGEVVTTQKIQEADEESRGHFGQPLLNVPMYQYIIDKHGGRLPIEIKAVS